MAAAVLKLWPEALPTIGPAIENGFYYDFDNLKITEEDLPKIEKEMRSIVRHWDKFEHQEVSKEEAKKHFKNNPYKLELIDELAKNKQKISFYKSGDFVDLCAGGHVDDAQKLEHFKLLSLAGAYWRGNEKNKMLTRIYGTCFSTKQELESYLAQIENAKKRDHRKIGKTQNLFTFSNLVGKGLPLFTEYGAAIWREIERFVVDEEMRRGYKHVRTPNLAKVELYKKSGHYPYYKNTMYPPMKIDEDELILRPMTCPHHFALYMDRPRSYKDLPIRYAELASLYRYEKSGELTGLLRVREFCLADSHNFVRKDQVESEINSVLDLIEYITKSVGFIKGKNFTYRLSLGDRKNTEKFYAAPESWDFAEKTLRNVLTKRKEEFEEAVGEAAFYGPKIDIQMKNVSGKEDTAFTVQYDFCLPERFDLSYTNEKGEKEQPIVIHRSSIGALERTIGFLIEHYAGAFPVWLSPVQAKILPITERQLDYANKILENLKKENIRVELDNRNETLQAKIRDAQIEKVPYMLVIGGREEEAGKIAVRQRDGQDLGQIPLEQFVVNIKNQIENKLNI